MTGRGEQGFAVLAAMVAAAICACLAADVSARSQAAAIAAGADAGRARSVAAAEAGFAIALAGLQDDNPAARWRLDGELRTIAVEGAPLLVRVEDEWGKIPLNTINRSQARAMFVLAGAGPDADALTDAFLQARDDTGADGRRRAGFGAVAELKALPRMTGELYAAIAPAATVFARDSAFEPRTSTPLSLEVMTGAAPGSPEVIARERAMAGETPAIDTGPPLKLAGRPLTLRVQPAFAGQGGWARAEVVELTRAPDRPYVVRGLAEAAP